MVILITGASHTGKTLLAQRMLERYGYPYLSMDHLKMGLIRSGQTRLTPEDDEELTAYLWPIVREMMKTAIENRQDLIVEGCYVPYDWRQDFPEGYLAHIRFLCLAMTDDYIDGHFDEIRAHGSDIESRLDDSDCTAAHLKAENRKYAQGFRAAGEEIVWIEGDYLKTIWGIENGFFEKKHNVAQLKKLCDLSIPYDQIQEGDWVFKPGHIGYVIGFTDSNEPIIGQAEGHVPGLTIRPYSETGEWEIRRPNYEKIFGGGNRCMRRNRLIKRIISIILILLMVALLCALAVLLFRLFSKQQEDMLSSEEYAWQDDWQPFEASYHDYLEKGLPQAWERKLVLNDVINLEFDPLSRDLGLIEYSAKYSTLLEQLEASEPTDTVRYNIRFLRELFAFQKECKRPLEVNQEIQIDLDLDGETETILIERTETDETIFGTQEYHYTVWVNGTTIKMCDKLSVIPLEQSFSTTEAKFSFLHLGGKQAILCELTGYMESWPDSADPAKDYLYIYRKGTAGCFELLDGYYSMVTPEGHLIVNGLRPNREPIIRWPVPQYSWSEYSISDSGIQQVLREGWLACYFDEITIKKELLLTLQDGSEKELPSNTRLINIAYSEEGNLCVVSDTDDFGRLKVKYSENGFPLLLPTEEEMDLFFNIETEQDLAHNWFY